MADGAGNIFTVTVADPGSEARHIETAHIAQALDMAARDVRAHGGAKTSGKIVAAFGKVLGEWTYRPTAN